MHLANYDCSGDILMQNCHYHSFTTTSLSTYNIPQELDAFSRSEAMRARQAEEQFYSNRTSMSEHPLAGVNASANASAENSPRGSADFDRNLTNRNSSNAVRSLLSTVQHRLADLTINLTTTNTSDSVLNSPNNCDQSFDETTISTDHRSPTVNPLSNNDNI